MDLNHDGKHDYKDDAIFYNEVVKGEENSQTQKGTKRNQTNSSSSSSLGSGATWFIALLILWLFTKLLGG